MVFLRFHVLYLFKVMCYPHTARVRPVADSQSELYGNQFMLCTVKQSSPVKGLEWPRGFQEVKVPRFHDNGTRWC